MKRPPAATIRRIRRAICFFYLTEASDIRRAIGCDAQPADALKAKYASLKTKINPPSPAAQPEAQP